MTSLNYGQVCGTDGVTYNSICHLRSQSANAQVDYKGACEDGDDKKPWEICRSIKDEKKLCEDTQETCTRRVLSKDGCCPICGRCLHVSSSSHLMVVWGGGSLDRPQAHSQLFQFLDRIYMQVVSRLWPLTKMHWMSTHVPLILMPILMSLWQR